MTGVAQQIPADEDLPLNKLELKHFTDYQVAVGGSFQCLDIEEPWATIYVNEEGKLIGLPVNRRATLLWWIHDAVFRGHDVIMGDVVVVGQLDEEGDTLTIPPELYNRLMEPGTYKVQVQTAGDGDTWNGNARRYDDWVSAYNDGLSLAQRWTAVTNVRVVPA